MVVHCSLDGIHSGRSLNSLMRCVSLANDTVTSHFSAALRSFQRKVGAAISGGNSVSGNG